MKKEFLDYLYEQRAALQASIDKQVEFNKLPNFQCCDKMPEFNVGGVKLEELRKHIFSINKAIEKYIELHTKTI